MKYFTQELYQDFQIDNTGETDIEWDSRCEFYKNYIESIEHLFPEGVKKLSKSCFHDWHLTAAYLHEGNLVLYVSDMINNMVTINYKTTKPIEIKDNIYWLYDEIDIEKEGFVHRILFHDNVLGLVEIDVPFTDVEINNLLFKGR